MATQSSSVMETLRKRAIEMQASAETEMDVESTSSDADRAAYEARLDHTVRNLRELVRQQEVALEKLQASSSAHSPLVPSSDSTTRLRQLRAMKAAYDKLATEEPTLPSKDSPLPALLALRNTTALVAETDRSTQTLQSRLAALITRLNQEESENRSAKLLTSALEARINRLKTQQQETAKRSPAQAAKDMIREQERRKVNYEKETKLLVKAFNDFIDIHLASMLAAEELGGPIVGEMMDISDETLEAGFSLQGKIKRRSSKVSNGNDQRQRRIDHIWGPVERNGEEQGSDDGGRSEKEAAGAEMRILAEELLNAAAAGGGSGGYVELQRDSAAARFLVRAKAAQFHPKDATKLRLLDFGREIDG
ncbi:MAG: hypothetical protein M1835_007430 [Candelina submexicana]|nr:MAG: hypothetical protein M1835_007430 [Candelina submexicana]